ncbi:hypothetical protein LZ554_006707 [Drepanopeziza brunnea f. sp. 'monogermtubi']|nr:hypothetical protein LZ554_006707 [Drepanopeziza brunnea f. sp. 'monogermtubi']
MSLRGSPIGWFKEKRQTSHSGLSTAKRPATAAGAFPWADDRDISKLVERAVLAAFESDAFKIAVASQIDPAIAKTQEKLGQIRTANLNLDSALQAHIEDVPTLLHPIQDHLTSLVIPDYAQDLEALGGGQKRLEAQVNDLVIPDHGKELNEIASAQSQLLTTMESRFESLGSRMDDLDRRLGEINEAAVNADLRTAIRFGEISNELQDRNTTLGDRVWGVERELGKKVDALQRKVVAACEDVGRSVRNNHEVVETMRAKLEEDDVLAAVSKANSRAEFSEKAFRRSITAIHDKVSALDTSAISTQTARLEVIERGVSDFRKEAEAARNLASISSKFLSANTSKLDTIAAAVGKMQIMVESTNETCQVVSESQEQNAESIKEDVEAVRMHVRSLDNLAVTHARRLSETSSMFTRVETALTGSNANTISKLEDLESTISRVEDGLKPLSAHTAKLDNLQTNMAIVVRDVKPHKGLLDDLASTISELRSNVDSAFTSHTESLDTIQQKVYDTSSLDQLTSSLSDVKASIERKLASSLESSSKSTVEQINSQIGAVDLKLQAKLKSVAEDANLRAEKIDASTVEVLDEVRSTKAFLKTENADRSEQFRSTRELIKASQAAHSNEAKAIRHMLQEVQEASKEDEILLQIESWTQTCVAKQAAEVASVKELLHSSREREETWHKLITEVGEKNSEISELLRSGKFESSSTTRELAGLKSMLENGAIRSKETDSNTELVLQSLQAGIEQIKDSTTLSTIEELVVQNGISLANSHEAILAIDKEVKSGEENIRLAVREVQTALAKNLLDAAASITSSNSDGVADLKADLGSKISISTNVLRADFKSIDLSSTTTAVEALKDEISSSLQAAHSDRVLIADDIKSSVSTAIDTLVTDVRDFGNVHSRELQENGAVLLHIEEAAKTNATSLAADLASIQKAVGPVSEAAEDIALLLAAVEKLDQTSESNTTSLMTVQESVLSTNTRLDAVSGDLQTAIDTSGSRTMAAVDAGFSGVQELRNSGEEQVARLRGDIEKVFEKASDETSKCYESMKLDISGLAESAKRDNADLKSTVVAGLEVVKSQIIDMGQGIDTRLEKTYGGTNKALETIILDVSSLKESSPREDSTTMMLSSFEDVKSHITTRVQDIHADLERLAVETAKSQDETRAIKCEVMTTREAVVSHAEKSELSVTSNLEAAQASIIREVGNLRKALCSDLSEIIVSEARGTSGAAVAEIQQIKSYLESKLQESNQQNLSSISQNLDSISQEVSGNAMKLHEATLTAIETGSKSSSDIVVREAGKMNDLIETAKEAFSSRTDDTNKWLESLRASLGTISEDLNREFKAAAIERKDAGEVAGDHLVSVRNLVQQQTTAIADIQSGQHDLLSEVRVLSASTDSKYKSLSEIVVRESQGILAGQTDLAQQETTALAAMESRQQEILSGVSDIQKSTETIHQTLEDRTSTLSDSIDMGFSDAIVHRTAAEKSREASMATLSGLIKQEAETNRIALESTKDRVISDVTSVSAFLDTMGKSLEQGTDTLSGAVSRGFAEASTQRGEAKETLSANLTTVSASLKQEMESTISAVEATRKDLQAEIHKSHRSLESFAQRSQQSVDTLLGATQKGFESATSESTESRKAQASHFATLTESVLGGAKTTSEAVEALHQGITAEVKKTNFDLKHSLGGLKLHAEQMSGSQNNAIAGLGDQISCLDGKTQEHFARLEASGEARTNALSGTIDQMTISLQTEIDSITDNMKTIDAAVRVNSAAIARVDKAVLESSSQVKNVVLDHSNRELLASLDEELHATGRRVRAMTEFEIPRLEAIAKKSRDAVEVIGGRVIGTTKKFDEMVAHHGQKHQPNHNNNNGLLLDRSEMLLMSSSASGRLRKGSNASNSSRSKDSAHYRMASIETGRS